MFKKAATVTMSLALAACLTAASFNGAEARGRNRGAVVGGVALGVLALGAMGAYGAERYRGGCERGPRECRWVEGRCKYNRYGEYVCRDGREECFRRSYCD